MIEQRGKEYIIDNSVINEESGCWEWQLAKEQDGYGVAYQPSEKKYYRAHRLSYTLFNGEITEPCICHSCDNPQCVNPEHLWQGTHKDNQRDKSLKGRTAYLSTPEKRKFMSEVHKGKPQETAHVKKRMEGTMKTLSNLKCPHCDKIGSGPVMYKWHFGNCKHG